MGASISPCVWVSDEDQTRSRAIIAEWEERCRADRTVPRTLWKCARCDEAVEGSFDICWNCQTQRSTEPHVARPPREGREEPGRWWWPLTTGGSGSMVFFVLMGWLIGAIGEGRFGGLFYAVYAYFFAILFRAVYLKVSGRAGWRV